MWRKAKGFLVRRRVVRGREEDACEGDCGGGAASGGESEGGRKTFVDRKSKERIDVDARRPLNAKKAPDPPAPVKE